MNNWPMNFGNGFQFMFVVQPAQHHHHNRAERNDAEFHRAPVQAVCNQVRLAGDVHAELDENCAGRQRQQHAGEHGESAGERHGRIVDFALAGVVHEICVEAPSAPKRQREQRGQQRAGKGGQKKIEGKPWIGS